MMEPVLGYDISFFSMQEKPFGISYDDWVAKFWNWNQAILKDPDTQAVIGLNDNGCLIQRDNSMAILMDTALGGSRNQVCTIPAGTGIMIPIWTGLSDPTQLTQDEKKVFAADPLKALTDSAKSFDMGRVTGELKVNGITVAKLDAKDLTTILNNNVTEVTTKIFNLTIPKDSHIPHAETGVFPAVAHGWFVFMKPIPSGQYTIYYQNTASTSLESVSGNINNAQITYSLTVE
jgi:hypothetical protein